MEFSSMRPIGFSTGALAYADFRGGLEMVRHGGLSTIELSALQQNEWIPLLNVFPSLNLPGYEYVSIHAPSQYDPAWEGVLLNHLRAEAWRGWAIVIHPDAISDFGLWRELGAAVCIENMDKRKPIGRTANEFTVVFKELPAATLGFAIGPARQTVLPMTQADSIRRELR